VKSTAKRLCWRNCKENLKTAVEASKELEASYRSLHLFYKNAKMTILKCYNFNAELEQLKDWITLCSSTLLLKKSNKITTFGFEE